MVTTPNPSSESTPPVDDLGITARYNALLERVDAAAKRSGRTGKDIIVVLVSKYGTLEQIRELIAAGHVHFGESRAQQLEQRSAQISDWIERMGEISSPGSQALPDGVNWHMIGHLQRNKARKTIKSARLIQTVDSLRLAEEIQAIAAKGDEPVDVLVQVNVSGEPKKTGITPPAVPHIIDQIETMINVQVRGLMCMAENTENDTTIRHNFEQCSELFEEIRRRGNLGPRFNILSMGMSNDFESAIECGANCIRVGSAIFQDEGRPKPSE